MFCMSAKRRTLFDPGEARGPRDKPDVGKFKGKAEAAEGLSVSALLGKIKAALADAFPQRVTVVGELSNVSQPASGHVYFSLKDSDASIGAAMWKARAGKLKFTPRDGMEVVVEGKVDVYDVQGKLQLYVERMTPRGEGALELAFRQLKEKLQAEGLFEAGRKKAIPAYPRAIGLVTSATGAAVRDIQRTLRRRWPAADVYLLPAMVQGDEAAGQIAEAVGLLDRNAGQLGIETIIVARGGGSLEDLWAFNEEPVARAIAAAAVPIISGVGHEVDVTIADLVADMRAATPTAAAELATPDVEEIRRRLANLSARLARNVKDIIAVRRAALEAVQRSAIFRDPTARVRTMVQRVDELSRRLTAGTSAGLAGAHRRLGPLENRLAALHPARLCERARGRLDNLEGRLRWALSERSKLAADRLAVVASRLGRADPSHRLRLARQRVTAASRQLEAMSYRNVLARGFSVTRDAAGAILRSVSAAGVGDVISTELADGAIRSRVEKAGAKSKSLPSRAKTATPKRRQTRKPDSGPTLFD